MRCPRCGKELSEGMRFCTGCGLSLESAQEQKKKYCTVCGTELLPTATFCTVCGTERNQRSAYVPPQTSFETEYMPESNGDYAETDMEDDVYDESESIDRTRRSILIILAFAAALLFVIGAVVLILKSAWKTPNLETAPLQQTEAVETYHDYVLYTLQDRAEVVGTGDTVSRCIYYPHFSESVMAPANTAVENCLAVNTFTMTGIETYCRIYSSAQQGTMPASETVNAKVTRNDKKFVSVLFESTLGYRDGSSFIKHFGLIFDSTNGRAVQAASVLEMQQQEVDDHLKKQGWPEEIIASGQYSTVIMDGAVHFYAVSGNAEITTMIPLE